MLKPSPWSEHCAPRTACWRIAPCHSGPALLVDGRRWSPVSAGDLEQTSEDASPTRKRSRLRHPKGRSATGMQGRRPGNSSRIIFGTLTIDAA